ncbi:MAG: hypothetical protein QN120_06070 [Armatimonadota bacterium]|nr:hypothetical protein [Armatimonadota bacterium]
MRIRSLLPLPAVVALVTLLVAVALAQQQEVRPPIARVWMDVATNIFAAPRIPGAPPLPPMFVPPRENQFGYTRHMFGRYLDTALFVRTRPQGIQATHGIPQGLRLGASLPLEPVRPAAASPGAPSGERDPGTAEQPKGRVLFYWGCSADVRPGQPRTVDFARASAQEWATVWQGRFVPERGAQAEPGHSIWPNERDKRILPDGASLQGEHTITGDGVPPGLRFAIGAAQDLMPAIEPAVEGEPQASLSLRWRALPTARAYFLGAFGAKGNDLIIWSSSDVPEAGMGLFEYLPNANIERWTAERVLLAASTTQCAIPRGIFADTEGALLRMIAYGEELNLVAPPRPSDPRVVWEQQWALRVRVKSTLMMPLTLGR